MREIEEEREDVGKIGIEEFRKRGEVRGEDVWEVEGGNQG